MLGKIYQSYWDTGSEPKRGQAPTYRASRFLFAVFHGMVHLFPFCFLSFLLFIFAFTTQKSFIFAFSFPTLGLCLRYFHTDFPVLGGESTLGPVADTLSTRWSTIAPADRFLRCRQPHQSFGSHSTNSTKSALAHATRRFWSFPNFLGVKVNNSTPRGSGQPRFIRAVL